MNASSFSPRAEKSPRNTTTCLTWAGVSRRLRDVGHPILVGILCFCATGCSRQYWRNQADAKSYGVIGERYVDPRWANPRTDLTPDPLSRFYDPNDPDCGPLPPDDPAANQYMQCAYGMHGSSAWDKFGYLPTIENPAWLEPYGGSSDVVHTNYSRPGTLPEIKNLTLEEAVGLSYRHSREFQRELENVYLTALTLTFQRFRFDTQFIGLSGRRPGADLFGNFSNDQSNLNLDSRAGVSQFFPTGAQFAAELANNTVWLFSGPNSSNTQSALSFSLVQPLLRNGGRRFAMESLTQAERNVLYAVRDLARYRQGFFTNVVAGTRSSGSVSNVGGSFGFNNGYLQLLQQYQQILNQQFNIRLQEQQIEQLLAQNARPESYKSPLENLPQPIPAALLPKLTYDPVLKLLILTEPLTQEELNLARGVSDDLAYLTALGDVVERSSMDITSLSVTQIQSQLVQQRINLANALRAYQDALDAYKLGLGLPTDTTLTIDTSILEPFQLIDPKVVAAQDNFRFFVRVIEELDQEDPDQKAMGKVADDLKALVDSMRREIIDDINADLEKAVALVEERKSAGKEEAIDNIPPYDPERDRRILRQIEDDLTTAEAALADLRGQLTQPIIPKDVRVKMRARLNDLKQSFYEISQGLALAQVDVRLELIPLNEFNLGMEEATAIALENRLDLMNFRSSVTDARRKVEVAANQLQAVLDLVAEGDVRTRSLAQLNDNPVDFRSDNSDYRVGVSFTTPIQLVGERNDYRAALIEYQRARRQYMLEEDGVKFDVRTAWRQLDTLRQNFIRSKFSIRVSALQYDQNVMQSLDPRRAQNTTGNQGLNLLNSFQSILNAQNTLISTWVNYETNRLNIYRDMGTMVIDEKGFWIDNYYQDRLARASWVTLPELRPVDPPVLKTPGSLNWTPVSSEPNSSAGVQSSDGTSADTPASTAPNDASPRERLNDATTLPAAGQPAQPPAAEPADAQPADGGTARTLRGTAQPIAYEAPVVKPSVVNSAGRRPEKPGSSPPAKGQPAQPAKPQPVAAGPRKVMVKPPVARPPG